MKKSLLVVMLFSLSVATSAALADQGNGANTGDSANNPPRASMQRGDRAGGGMDRRQDHRKDRRVDRRNDHRVDRKADRRQDRRVDRRQDRRQDKRADRREGGGN